MPNRVDIAAFQKVMIVYNRNSGKQLFASMLARVKKKKKRLKQETHRLQTMGSSPLSFDFSSYYRYIIFIFFMDMRSLS